MDKKSGRYPWNGDGTIDVYTAIDVISDTAYEYKDRRVVCDMLKETFTNELKDIIEILNSTEPSRAVPIYEFYRAFDIILMDAGAEDFAYKEIVKHIKSLIAGLTRMKTKLYNS